MVGNHQQGLLTREKIINKRWHTVSSGTLSGRRISVIDLNNKENHNYSKNKITFHMIKPKSFL